MTTNKTLRAATIASAAAFCALATVPPPPAPAQEIDLGLEIVAEGFDQPTHVASANDGTGRLFVSEFGGKLKLVRADGTVAPEPFLDLSGEVDFLYSAAFHPDYANNGRFFVYVLRHLDEPDIESYVAERRVDPADPDRADPDFQTIVMEMGCDFPCVGGLLRFAPDGTLWIGAGDNEIPENGQDRSNLLGKILRVDVDSGAPYEIPPDNPFVGEPGVREEIWAYGLRNPWRFSIDEPTGRVHCSDVGSHGDAAREEINLLEAGGNYGWPLVEGFDCNPEHGAGCDPGLYEPPILAYAPDEGTSAIGASVYRGARFPGLQGVYFFSDWTNGKIYSLGEPSPGVFELRHEATTPNGGAVGTFGIDEDGEIIAADYFRGVLYRLTDASAREGSGLAVR